MREIWIRPSSAGRWAAPGGCEASATYAPPPSGHSETIYTIRGTRLHAAAAFLMDASQKPSVQISQDDWETARHALEEAKALIDFDAYNWVVERKIGLDIDGVWIDGTPDLVGISKTDPEVPVEIIDYKFGQGHIVEAEDNWQLRVYSLLVRDGDGGYDIGNRSFNVRIVQPANAIHHQPPVKTAFLPADTVTHTLDHLRAVLGRLRAPGRDPEHNPTPDNCQWCHAKGVCPAFQSTGMSTVEESELRVNDDSTSFRLPVAEYANFLERAKIVEQMRTAVELAAERRLREGKHVPGLKLVQTRLGQRRWSNEDEACAEMEKWPGGASVMWAEPKVRTPKQAEEEFRRMGEHEAASALGKFVVRTPPIVKIVREDDPRPEIGPRGALSHFAKKRSIENE